LHKKSCLPRQTAQIFVWLMWVEAFSSWFEFSSFRFWFGLKVGTCSTFDAMGLTLTRTNQFSSTCASLSPFSQPFWYWNWFILWLLSLSYSGHAMLRRRFPRFRDFLLPINHCHQSVQSPLEVEIHATNSNRYFPSLQSLIIIPQARFLLSSLMFIWCFVAVSRLPVLARFSWLFNSVPCENPSLQVAQGLQNWCSDSYWFIFFVSPGLQCTYIQFSKFFNIP
jgi:hypothetical protein